MLTIINHSTLLIMGSKREKTYKITIKEMFDSSIKYINLPYQNKKGYLIYCLKITQAKNKENPPKIEDPPTNLYLAKHKLKPKLVLNLLDQVIVLVGFRSSKTLSNQGNFLGQYIPPNIMFHKNLSRGCIYIMQLQLLLYSMNQLYASK